MNKRRAKLIGGVPESWIDFSFAERAMSRNGHREDKCRKRAVCVRVRRSSGRRHFFGNVSRSIPPPAGRGSKLWQIT